MSRRQKNVALSVPQSDDEAREIMSKLGRIDRDLEQIGHEQSEKISEIKAEAEKRAAPLKEEAEVCQKKLQAWAEAHRNRLTRGGKVKFFDLGTGKISWRMKPPSVGISKKETVLASLKALGFNQFIRTQEEINKDAMLAEPEKAKEVKGVKINRDIEEFIIEPVKEPVSEGVAA